MSLDDYMDSLLSTHRRHQSEKYVQTSTYSEIMYMATWETAEILVGRGVKLQKPPPLLKDQNKAPT